MQMFFLFFCVLTLKYMLNTSNNIDVLTANMCAP